MFVVSAGIIQKDNKILIAKRKKGKCLEPLWEFPGGKLENCETIKECLKREIKEELDIEIDVLEFFCSTEFKCKEKHINLISFKANYLSGEIVLNDHNEIRWVDLDEIKDYEFVSADKVIVEKLLKST